MAKRKIYDLFGNLIKKRDSDFISPKEIRVGIISSIFIYTAFGVVDRFMLPINYKLIWTLRFLLIIPALSVFYILTYKVKFYKNVKIWLTLLVIVGQLGINLMILIAEPNEPAYLEYYAGLILVMMWAAFVFRLTFIQMILVTGSIILTYNFIAIGIQRLPFKGISSVEFSYFVGNNFILISSSLLATLGSILLSKYSDRLYNQNIILEKEKKALIKAKRKAEESDRLKSSFLSNMSHEMRTPMNAIIGFAELLKKPYLSKLKEKKYITIIQSKGQQLMQLMNDIIDISKIEANELYIEYSSVNLNQMLDELAIIYKESLNYWSKESNIKIVLNKPLDNEQSIILTDKYRLRQILNNLLNNSVKFTNKGEINFGYHKPENKKIIIYVKDTGCGIPDNKKKIIFDRFRQVDENNNRPFGGTGLGLNIVKNLVRLIGGELQFESTVGIGTEFNISIPYKNITSTYKKENFNITSQNKLKDLLILIAEDEENNYYLLEEILDPFDVKIIWAKNGQEAVDKFKTSKEINLILMDLKMPILDGFKALKLIKKINKNIPVIAQTAYAVKDDIHNILSSGFDDIITKPIDNDQLIKLIRKQIQIKTN